MAKVLGVDSSTQACKVEVRDADTGKLVASGRAPHPATKPPRSEQDPEAWWRALVEAVAQTGEHAIDAISIAGQQHGMVTLDASGRVVRPAKLWNDTESAPDATWLVDQLSNPQEWATACGSVPVAAFTITKLSWLHRREPVAWQSVRRVLLPHDYLNYRLSAAAFTDRGDASGTGYWSPRDDTYRFELLAILDRERDWSEVVPRVVGPREVHASVTRAAAAELDLRTSPIVAPGTGDNMAAALGIGLRPGDVAISLGTSGTVFATDETPTADATGAVAGFADATGRFLPLVCTLNATLVTQTFAALLGISLERLDQLALAGAPGAGGLVLVPYLAGERTPNRPDASGSLSGLRGDTGREQLARAAFEGVVCGLLDGLDALDDATTTPHDQRLVLVGGGARSAAYRQIVADLANREVIVPAGDEHVAMGACLQAASVLHDAEPAEIAAGWEHGRASLVAPSQAVDHEGVRAAYAAARG
jgi:xylulokinase